jgi:hypothetical protein
MSETFTIKQDRERYGMLSVFEGMPEEFIVTGLSQMQSEDIARLLSEHAADNAYRVLPQQPTRRPPPRTTEEYFYGALAIVAYLQGIANETQGAGVWRAMLTSLQDALIAEARAKGFTLK